MNNTGQAVGYYYNPNGPFAFLYDSNADSYSTISNAGWFNLEPGGINDAAQMAGSYEDSPSVWHGFIATPQ
jgi:hypothetical protein